LSSDSEKREKKLPKRSIASQNQKLTS
jgi:hypothetical protein